MAGIITISPGHDASYPWRQIGTSAQGDPTGRSAVDYYLSPAHKGGEPPGQWRGGGLADLGFRDGQTIEREVFERLYGEFIDPRDPAGETRLGRAPQQFRSADQIHAELCALEPEATAERRAELLIEAKSQVRMPVMYFDVTFSVSKSITLLHASAMANADRAATDGDVQAAAYWEQAAADVWSCVEEGNRAALEYLQREAGYTRSGYHGRQLAAVPTGRWEDAHGFVVGSFAQHTSRDGDPQLHIHNLVLNRVRRERDGEYRTLDSKALFEHRGAAAAIAVLVMESALSGDFGVSWVRRADGHGREVDGVCQELMAEFSSRRRTISELTARLAAEFETQHGYAPDARALGKLRLWANHASRRAKDGEPLDLAAEVRRWAEQARVGEAGALEPVMPAVSNRRGTRAEQTPEPEPEPAQAQAPVWELTPEQEQELTSQALACVQEAEPTWTKADLIRHLGELFPDAVACSDVQDAAALLEELASKVLAGSAGHEVAMLEAPEWPRVPDSLRRADGRSVFRPHGATRYATRAHLTMEERLIERAQQRGAPRLTPEMAALLLGADQAQLKAQLQAAAQDAERAQNSVGSGLRLDQAAAAYLALTSDRRAEVMVGPAGSGKTRTAAVVARIWHEAGMGEVYALTTSQAARNVLHEAGIGLADNTAEFLGHLAGQREARGVKMVQRNTLLILDEASMMSMPDMAAILREAEAEDCRVLITGDHEQIAAVDGGGGMTMLANRLGYVQLAEPVRFTHEWERDATLQLRAGDTSVIAQYEEQGRLRGGDSEMAMDQACRAWLADHLAGMDALLIARTEEQARELSRRVRDDLIRLGQVRAGREAGLKEGETASRGDLVMARKNVRQIIAGEQGRWLTNRDVLQVLDVGTSVVTVRRLAGRESGTGAPEWTPPFELSRRYLRSNCELAYATTAHAAQGRTVDTAHVLVDGIGDRQGLYVAMSRGRLANFVYCVTGFRQADARGGSQAAPELERARRQALGDPDLNRFMTELADAMDGRVRRIGEHLAEARPGWAVTALGEVPGDPVRRQEWEERAGRLGAYRELYGYSAPGDAIGPEPGRTSPEARADWHAAFAALGKVEGIDLRGCSDDQLWLRRAMYERETSWAPRHVGEELRLARLQARTAWENSILDEHLAKAALSADRAQRHETLAGMWRAMHDRATEIVEVLGAAQETRRQWEALTESTRRAAIAADLELRRRRPGIRLPTLKSAEPMRSAGHSFATSMPRPGQAWVQETLDGAVHLPSAAAEPVLGEPAADTAAFGRENTGQLAFSLTEPAIQPIPEEVLRIRDNARWVQEEIDKLRTVPEFAEDDDPGYLEPGWRHLTRHFRDAIIQPPKPDLVPAPAVLQQAHPRAVNREAEAE